ncbi:regulator of chromosome condensation, RCC1 [Rhodotorula diobovata]|uniref:Regulator of chromosome condensation, RCC1 n=1 Tax=Rhodotorula diobovata TaxID=5288 RepID=A0A5C5FYH5_9BASI|nr:regulator of chromosome condensation, RCC1 [Rhodotorula diobovata]
MAVLACGSNAFRQLADSNDLALPDVVPLPDAVSLEAASWSQSLVRNAKGELRCLGHPLAGRQLPTTPVKRWLGQEEFCATVGNDGTLMWLEGGQAKNQYDLADVNGRGELLAVSRAGATNLQAAPGLRHEGALRLDNSLADVFDSADDDGVVPPSSDPPPGSPALDDTSRRDVRELAAGAAHFLALISSGHHLVNDVHACGDSRYGQAGPFPSASQDSPRQGAPHYTSPRLNHLAFFDGLHPSQVSCGAFSSCVVTRDGAAYVFGSNKEGQLGLGADEPGGAEPALVELQGEGEDEEVEQVACGAAHSVLLTRSGQVWVTGANHDGQLGLGDLAPRRTWVRNRAVEDAAVAKCSSGAKRIKRVVCSRASTYFECE